MLLVRLTGLTTLAALQTATGNTQSIQLTYHYFEEIKVFINFNV